jgi:hypothetical protein
MNHGHQKRKSTSKDAKPKKPSPKSAVADPRWAHPICRVNGLIESYLLIQNWHEDYWRVQKPKGRTSVMQGAYLNGARVMYESIRAMLKYMIDEDIEELKHK